jgi:hypothetical protein
MKLREKFETKSSIDTTKEARVFASECEKIADDFAIGFVEWLSYRYKYIDNKGWFATTYHLEMGIFKTSEELLEIYKKENNL